MSFFRFPHTPHLAWLGEGEPRDDKVLTPDEAAGLLAHDVLVEEKIDGANVGISLDDDGELRLQNRGAYLTRENSHPQFKPIFRWLAPRADALAEALFPDLMLFGEWCYAVHSVRYNALPDWFMSFDVYDQSIGRFWSAERRNTLVTQLGLSLVPQVAQGCFDVPGLQKLFGKSRLGDMPAEGLYVRHDEGAWQQTRAKLVRPQFVQAIAEHWSHRALESNELMQSEISSMRRPTTGTQP